MAGFTAIAAGVGMATTAATTGASFGQAGKMKRKMQEANLAAAKSLAEARKKLEVNVYDALALPKEAYELEREALLVQGAKALQQATEGSARGAAATAGRIQQGMTSAQAQQRAAMGKELLRLEELSATEEARLRDKGFELDLQEAAGAQQAAAQYEQQAQQARAQGVQGAISVIGSAAEAVPLYRGSAKARQAALGGMQFSGEEFSDFGMIGQAGGLTEGQFSDLDFEQLGGMTPKEFRQFEKSLTPSQTRMLYGSQQFGDLYQDPFTSSGFGYSMAAKEKAKAANSVDYDLFQEFLEYKKNR